MTDTTPTALSPEELAARIGWPHESGLRLCGEKDIAAAIRQHSEALRAENERLKEQNADLEKAALAAYENGVEHAFEAAKEKAEAALAASLERERGMREALTVAYDLSTWAACINWRARDKDNQGEWLDELKELITRTQQLVEPLIKQKPAAALAAKETTDGR